MFKKDNEIDLKKALRENPEDLAWAIKQATVAQEGVDLLSKASDDAIEFIAEVSDELNNKEFKTVTTERLSLHIGIALTLVDKIIPDVYWDMRKSLPKKIGVSKSQAEMIANLYLARTIKNLAEALAKREE